MKIELGKTYLDGTGARVTIKQRLENPIYDWVYRGDNCVFFNEQGKSSLSGLKSLPTDLVEEVYSTPLQGLDETEPQLQQGKYVQEAGDMVNSPSHYTQGAVECIDAIQSALSPEEFRGYLRGNILKYMWRTNQKGGKQDLEKSLWYLNKLIEATE